MSKVFDDQTTHSTVSTVNDDWKLFEAGQKDFANCEHQICTVYCNGHAVSLDLAS